VSTEIHKKKTIFYVIELKLTLGDVDVWEDCNNFEILVALEMTEITSATARNKLDRITNRA